MTTQDLMEIILLAVTSIGLAPFLGAYMARVYRGLSHPLSFLGPLERLVYRLTGIDPTREMGWKDYVRALTAFSAASIGLLMAILMLQRRLPLNPEGFPGMSWQLAFNTAVSFVTNTNWQAYSGEATLSYFSQATGLAVQNFLSAAAGMSVAVALIKGIVARRGDASAPLPGIGNFWVDMTRTVIYILLPISLIGALVLVSQGVVMSLAGYTPAVSLEGKPGLIPIGPAASQTIIKHLGTNGGGFFGPNSAVPFENPSPFSNFAELLAEILIPFASPFFFGAMIGKKRQGYVIFGVMLSLLLVLASTAVFSEIRWGSLEGKELRFGRADSALFGVLTTVTSSGAVNAMHDSLSPLAGMITMLDIMLGEVVFGGVGSGLYGMLALVFVTVFIAGLMVGRGPEYLGKKIEARDIQLAMLAIIAPNAVILLLSAIAISLPAGLAGIGNPGPHGLSEVLYAFSSAAGNNGSAFAGLSANTPFYNLTLGLGMLVGRFGVMVPLIAVSGNLAGKRLVPEGPGSFRTDTLIFGVLLLSVVVIVAGLTHFPALTLGPILDHFLLVTGTRP